jgi:hypothetical protein
VNDDVDRVCRIHLAVGRVEACPGARCAFWDLDERELEYGCVLERLGIDLERPDLARYLVDLRAALEGRRSKRGTTLDSNPMADIPP